MKRSQSSYGKLDEVCYGEVKFIKPRPLARIKPVTDVHGLIEMAVNERLRMGGWQANPFEPYMRCKGSNTCVREDKFVSHAASIFGTYAGRLKGDDTTDREIVIRCSGFVGGTFNHIEFVGPLQSINDWLVITEKAIKSNSIRNTHEDVEFTFLVHAEKSAVALDKSEVE